MSCSEFQCVAVGCSGLQGVQFCIEEGSVKVRVLQCVAVSCSGLQCVAVGSVLYQRGLCEGACVAVCCSLL